MEITAPECASDPGSLCQWVWDNTGADFLARNSDQVAELVQDWLAGRGLWHGPAAA